MPWLPWILIAVAAGVAGIAVLGLLTFRVLAHARELGSTLERSRERLEPTLAAFEAASERRRERAQDHPDPGRADEQAGGSSRTAAFRAYHRD